MYYIFFQDFNRFFLFASNSKGGGPLGHATLLLQEPLNEIQNKLNSTKYSNILVINFQIETQQLAYFYWMKITERPKIVISHYVSNSDCYIIKL